MRRDEIHALGELAGEAVGGLAGVGSEMHEAIARRVFGALGPLGEPARIVHDGATATVHGAVRSSLRAAPRAGAGLLAKSRPDGEPLDRARLAGIALAALNGAVGDALTESESPLALAMTVRRHGRDVPLGAGELAGAFPQATSRLAIFVHGLIETEHAWRRPPLSSREAARPSYGSLLHRELGYTPVYVRYNTGRHISDNGRELARLLDDLVADWPVPVQEIALVGHSMGGLVARSACHIGEVAGHAFTGRVRHVFCLGSPHLGAPLEKVANVAGWTLARVPETYPFAKLVNVRSVGIKDLRFGSCAEEDWRDRDPDEFLTDRCREVPFLDSATYYFIGATVGRGPDDPLGHVLGDLLVRFPSASGRGRRRRIPFEVDRGRHIGGLTHFDLLNHPAVYEQLRGWLVPA
jgi:pimeloyl-ACP methyl ester carboxylesterase